jgi:nickel/cobalt transporter (NiCoT) family protein
VSAPDVRVAADDEELPPELPAGGGPTRGEWRTLAGMGAFIALLHVLGWGTLLLFVVPEHYQLGGTAVFGVGLGLTAYTLGMRHAFDADHIAAIDNTTRALQGGRRRPLSVGFWFSLGHSSIVFGLCVLVAFGLRAVTGQVQDDDSWLHQLTGTIGLSVSAGFLLLVGTLNLVVLLGILKVYRRSRSGQLDEAALEEQLARRGLLNRILGRATRSVSRPWHMYPVGLLFGLGFDTATEVSLLVLAGGAVAFALPWYAIMTLPVLFAAGMCLLDAADGAAMGYAYGWAFASPGRKMFYNLTVTALSVVVALAIGGLEVLALVTERMRLTSGPIAWLGSLDLGVVGFVLVGLFLAAWLGSVVVWRYTRMGRRMRGEVDLVEA